MPSNKELITQIVVLSGQLGLELETKDLKNDELVELVSDLRAKKKDADTQTAADDAEAKAKADAEAKAKKPPFSVAKGKSITSKRGILADGDEIKAKDLAGGQDAIDAFVQSGHIDKN